MASIIEQSKIAAKIRADLAAQAKASLAPATTTTQADPIEAKVEAPAEDAPKGGFKNIGLNQFFKANGTKVEPIKGYFIPEDAEEWDMLDFYSTKYALVEAPKE